MEEGQPMKLGELLYNVQISRFLNPRDLEDEAYLAGQPPPPNDKLYLGVFMLIENEADTVQEVRAEFTVVGNEGTGFARSEREPVALELGGGGGDDELPEPESIVANGPIEGAMVLFLTTRPRPRTGPAPRHPVVGRPGRRGRSTSTPSSAPSADPKPAATLANDRRRDGAAVPVRIDHHRRRRQLGSFAGAKAVNQASTFCSGAAPEGACWPGSSGFGPSSAVPVLPATCTPGSAAAVPVPLCTTWIIRLRTVLATSSEPDSHRLPWRPQLAIADDPGRAPHAAVGDRLGDRGHLERRGQHLALADRAHPQLEVFGDRGGNRALGRVDGPKGRPVEQAPGAS